MSENVIEISVSPDMTLMEFMDSLPVNILGYMFGYDEEELAGALGVTIDDLESGGYKSDVSAVDKIIDLYLFGYVRTMAFIRLTSELGRDLEEEEIVYLDKSCYLVYEELDIVDGEADFGKFIDTLVDKVINMD
jgi:hypothetical protein